MNKIKKCLIITLATLLILSNSVMASEKKTSLKLDHEGLVLKIYHLGEFKNNKLDLSLKFTSLNNDNLTKDYILNSNDGKVISQFENFIEKNDIKEDLTKTSDKNKKIEFESPRGLYLLSFERYLMGDEIISYKSTFLNIEDQDVNILGKHEDHPEDEFTQLKVIKDWKDDNSEKRPGKIYVDLYSNGEKLGELELTKEKNWRDTFTNLDPKQKYRVLEQVPGGYYSEIEYDFNTAYIINYLEDSGPTNPDDSNLPGDSNKPDDSNKPGDPNHPEDERPPGKDENNSKLPFTGLIWWPVGVFISIGIIFLTIYMIKRPNSEEK